MRMNIFNRHFIRSLSNTFNMHIHDSLKSWPQRHIGLIRIPFKGGYLSSLQFQGKLNIQPNAQKYTDCVICTIDILFGGILSLGEEVKLA